MDFYVDSERKALQKLLETIIAKKFMDNFNSALLSYKISNKSVSEHAGRAHNAFNKLVNQYENPQISTVLRFLHVANEMIKKETRNENKRITLEELIDEELRLTINIAIQVPQAEIKQLVIDNKDFFRSLNVYFSNESRRNVAFTKVERDVFESIQSEIKKG